MKKIFLLFMVVFAIGTIIGCKSETTNKTTSGIVQQQNEMLLVGKWEIVSAEEISLDSEEINILDSTDYMYFSFQIDEESINIITRTQTPPYEKTVKEVGYFISNDTVIWYYGDNMDTVPMWKILELTSNKFVFIDECYVDDGFCIPTYTMKRR